MTKQLTLGIDFDGTIVEEKFPGIGKLKPRTVELIGKAYQLGHTIIIWTSRSGAALEQARMFLDDNFIPYHYINENPECNWFMQGIQSRKLFCDYYLDDRAVHVDDIDKLFEKI